MILIFQSRRADQGSATENYVSDARDPDLVTNVTKPSITLMDLLRVLAEQQ
ncbi:MAG TPA: hypothetical protein VN648_33085 [Candidatus Methylomirabilis sp.]|nr:hypothetical protein [Candidatus Methylomirabilis sp.]